MTKGRSATTGFVLAAVATIMAQQNERYTRAHVAGDIATIDAMFTQDATCYPPGAEALVGRAAIRELTVEYVEAGVAPFGMDTTRCYGNEDLVVEQGTHVMTYGPDDVVERGKYLNVCKQEDGTWKVHANIWVASS